MFHVKHSKARIHANIIIAPFHIYIYINNGFCYNYFKNQNTDKEFNNSIPPLFLLCTLGISLAPTFATVFPPAIHKFNQRTLHVRLINLCISDKKTFCKIRHKETPRVHLLLVINLQIFIVNKSYQTLCTPLISCNR